MLRSHDTGHERVQAVRADDHAGARADGPAVVLAVAADPDDRTVLGEEFVDREAFPGLGSRPGCRIDQQLVQHCPPRPVRDGGFGGSRCAGKGEGPEVERVRVDGRTPRGDDTVEEPPPLQRRDPRGMDEVRGDRVAGEGRAIDDQDPVAVAGQQQRGGRPGTPRADDDDVVLILVQVAPPRRQRPGSADAGSCAWNCTAGRIRNRLVRAASENSTVDLSSYAPRRPVSSLCDGGECGGLAGAKSRTRD
jgi:hypothetical protein